MIDSIRQKIAALEKRVGQEGKSPLFAQLANYYLEINRAEDALKICDAGLANYPFYTTGHLIKGKALLALNMRAEAKREFEFVLSFFPKNETITALLNQTAFEERKISHEPVKPQAQPTEEVPRLAKEHTYTIPTAVEQKETETIIAPKPIEPPAVENPPVTNFFDVITQQPAPRPPLNTLPEEPVTKEAEPSLSDLYPVMQDISSTISEIIGTPKGETPTGLEPILPAETQESLTPAQEEQAYFDLVPPTFETGITIPKPLLEINEEEFGRFVETKRIELSGENTLSLEDYLNNIIPSYLQFELPKSEPLTEKTENVEVPSVTLDFPQPTIESEPIISLEVPLPAEEPIAESNIELPKSEPFVPPPISNEPDKIEELANKLQTATRITPNIDLTPDLPPIVDITEKETKPASEEDEGPPVAFVTPTLAEIYAKQGWYDDAIKAYKTLIKTKPTEKERFEKRIAELEELKKKSGK